MLSDLASVRFYMLRIKYYTYEGVIFFFFAVILSHIDLNHSSIKWRGYCLILTRILSNVH